MSNSSKKLTPFDFINSINSSSKTNLMADGDLETKKQYVPYIVNRTMSYFLETALIANEMNCNHRLDPQMQYDFYRYIVRPGKRFAKWIKPEEIEDLAVIAEYYGISQVKAKAALSILSKDDIKHMKAHISHGGMKKNK